MTAPTTPRPAPATERFGSFALTVSGSPEGRCIITVTRNDERTVYVAVESDKSLDEIKADAIAYHLRADDPERIRERAKRDAYVALSGAQCDFDEAVEVLELARERGMDDSWAVESVERAHDALVAALERMKWFMA